MWENLVLYKRCLGSQCSAVEELDKQFGELRFRIDFITGKLQILYFLPSKIELLPPSVFIQQCYYCKALSEESEEMYGRVLNYQML